MRRVLQRVDGDALDAAIGAWLAARDTGGPPPDQGPGECLRRSLTVDGKTVRGARRPDGTQVHLLAAMTGTGLVAAQREVDRQRRAERLYPLQHHQLLHFRAQVADLISRPTVPLALVARGTVGSGW
ncbi:hypothetical protein ACIG0C_36560 [Kitasatospora aureofaciens]|uniref:Uncharacterized protein n=1 Tax=Kitasatospora aureofaciens TaxID=1894 RepID=A0A1E7NEC4_KITAU|nr:hypothetical protein [Kitasatospora aureofaciens]ARF83300.1 hypothetical protein B6264_30675 [Kitasatospora aureofaciens]OEV39066.1 hypothetical protein HS99_0018390 [Kitasatospora aureofaciens]GGV03876.1 hypothetical protein GCM10010502_68290 [Kitasatospora aureofaciens]